jgi:hypothetical protein
MKMCIICGDKREDSNGNHINEDFCESCLSKETEFLHEIKRKREIKEALGSPAKVPPKPR